MSYRRQQAQHVSGRLRDALEEHLGDGAVFMDVEDIDGGTDFMHAIASAVRSCSSLLVVIGPGWADVSDGRQHKLDNARDVVRLEIEAALAHNLKVIPVLVDGAQMPSAEELPASIQSISRRQAITLDPARWGVSVTDVVNAIGRNSADPLRNRGVRTATKVAVAIEISLALLGLRTVGPSSVSTLDLLGGADPAGRASSVTTVSPTTAGSLQTKVSPATACTNDYLGYYVNLPEGMAASDDGDPFVRCEAFAFGSVDPNRYRREETFSVPIMFAQSTHAVPELIGLAREGSVLSRHDAVVDGHPATFFETVGGDDRGSSKPYWRDNAVVIRGPVSLLAQLKLPKSVGARTWRAARDDFVDLVQSLHFVTPRQCNGSEIWHCGDFYWNPKPINQKAFGEFSLPDARAGSELTLGVRLVDNDANDVRFTSIDWGDGLPKTGVLSRTGGPIFDDFVRQKREDGKPSGPWTAPVTSGGFLNLTCTHVYKDAGTYTVNVSFRTASTDPRLPRGHDPFGEFTSATTKIVVSPADSPMTSTSTSTPDSSTTTPSTAPPSSQKPACNPH